MLVPVLKAAHRAVRTFRAIPTYALFVAVKDRMQFWLERRLAVEHAAVKSVPKALNPALWGKEVLPCVLNALCDDEGSGYRCRALQDFRFFLRPDVVYHAGYWRTRCCLWMATVVASRASRC